MSSRLSSPPAADRQSVYLSKMFTCKLNFKQSVQLICNGSCELFLIVVAQWASCQKGAWGSIGWRQLEGWGGEWGMGSPSMLGVGPGELAVPTPPNCFFFKFGIKIVFWVHFELHFNDADTVEQMSIEVRYDSQHLLQDYTSRETQNTTMELHSKILQTNINKTKSRTTYNRDKTMQIIMKYIMIMNSAIQSWVQDDDDASSNEWMNEWMRLFQTQGP